MGKVKKECAECKATKYVYFSSKHQKPLCRIHAYQMEKYGEIRNKDEKACEMCGERHHAFFRKNYKMVLCRKHDDHMHKYGKIIKKTPDSKNEILITGDTAEIILSNRYGQETGRAMIDAEDVEKVSDLRWRDGKVEVSGISQNKKSKTALHRYIMDCKSKLVVFHLNGNYYDNRKCNLKTVTAKERNLLRKKTVLNSSGYTGVRWVKEKKKWSASISINGKLTYLGHYKDMEEAITVRLQGEKEYYGQFAPQKHLFEEYNIK